MGWKYTVEVWDGSNESKHWYWLKIYEGNSLFKGIYYMWWAKRNGWHCMKLEWRS